MTGRAQIYSRRWLLLALLIAITLSAQTGQQGGGKLKVMTYNVYAGTSYTGATSPILTDFKKAMTDALSEARANDPAGRAARVADEIVAFSPHLVSLQEVFTVSTGPSKDNLTLEYDYLELLTQALAARGAYYTPVESVTTWGATVPYNQGYLRSTWRIVILARADMRPDNFHVTNSDGDRFVTTIPYSLSALNGSTDCPEPLTGTSCIMPWPRGWAFVDVTYRGEQFRFVNATLESNSNSRNIAQGQELMAGPLNTILPIILAADLNCDLSNLSDPKRVTCTRLLDAGFIDAWGAAKSSDPGFTKELPVMTKRGDYVMLKGLYVAESAALVGDQPADMTASGVWPSNHAAVVVKLERP